MNLDQVLCAPGPQHKRPTCLHHPQHRYRRPPRLLEAQSTLSPTPRAASCAVREVTITRTDGERVGLCDTGSDIITGP